MFTPTAKLDELYRQVPILFWTCLVGIGAVICHHLFFSFSPSTSFIPSFVLASLPLWTLCFTLLRNRDQLWLMLSVLVGVFAIVSVLDFISTQQRAHAPLRDPGNYVTLLYLVWLPWAFRHFGETWRGWKLLMLGGLSFVFVLAMLASHSRAAMAVALFGCALQLPASWYFRKGWQAAGVVCLAGLIATTVYVGLDQGGIDSALATGPKEAAGGDRGLLWSSTWQGILELGGLTGTGLLTFSLVYPQFRSPLEQSTAGVIVHNDFLQMFLEGGLLLFTPLLFMVCCIAFCAVRNLGRRDDPARQTWYLLALGVALVHAAINFVFYSLPLAIVFGILIAKSFAPQELTNTVSKSSSWRSLWLKGLGVCLLLVNLVFLSVDVFTLGVIGGHNHVPYAKYVREDVDRMRSYLAFAEIVNAGRALPMFAEATLMEQDLLTHTTSMGFAQTDAAYKRAVASDLWNPLGFLTYADFLGRFGRGSEVETVRERLLQKAFVLDPTSVQINIALLAWYQQTAQWEGLRELNYNVAKWCQLMSKRPNAPALFTQVLELSRQVNDDELNRRMEKCLALDSVPSSGGRKRTWFMRWLDRQSAY